VTHPPDIILIFDIVIAHNGDEPLKDWVVYVRDSEKFRLTKISANEFDSGTNYLRQPRYHCI